MAVKQIKTTFKHFMAAQAPATQPTAAKAPAVYHDDRGVSTAAGAVDARISRIAHDLNPSSMPAKAPITSAAKWRQQAMQHAAIAPTTTDATADRTSTSSVMGAVSSALTQSRHIMKTTPDVPRKAQRKALHL
jgi:hypothetical protein